MKRDYTGRFQIGQTVVINDPRNRHHGQPRIVVGIVRGAYAYKLDDGFCYPESELATQAPAQPVVAPAQRESWDADSGLGIGGINNDQTMPIVPSVAAIARVQRMHDTDTVCRRCGASAHFDGAMFTTLGGTNICDDCA